ncbi:hydrogenase expression/formation protein HypE [Nitriliruptor alkaliphilus]|uniref:hydrogenase expression/formation protein HypE n=1 Tax=Nitriliruptor alkaliphilus TaxID=427918 RepID=UPI000698258C|nr:hydrogenase expression/formation protein HypE [Nitriliruptor alkaliphilus]
MADVQASGDATTGGDLEGWTCPLPLRDRDRIVAGHGGGGLLSAELIEHLFLPAFGAAAASATPTDAATLTIGGARLAFSTDAFVVDPLFFPGGNIGDLAINGTVNDVAMSGAVPVALSTAFVMEEGLELSVLGTIAETMGRAAAVARVQLVTGDTKVVDTGDGSGVTITTTGIGLIPDGVELAPGRIRPGDKVILSGRIGDHGVAVMSVREGIRFGTEVRSDSASMADLVTTMLAAPGAMGGLHCLRDATRGGMAASLCELAATADVGIRYVERAVPVDPAVASACSFLGLDPIHVANEGKLVAFVAPEAADAVLAAMQRHPLGRQAVIIGEVVDDHRGVVVARTGIGATRIVDRPLGEQLPRIC